MNLNLVKSYTYTQEALMDHIAGDGNISLYVDTTKDHSIRITVEPRFAVITVTLGQSKLFL